jgi:HD-GYP domain-containing protein (c-di-GMP phosphodiesterase class II)
MRQHPAIGAQIVQHVKSLTDVVPVVLYHQEKYDGTGYPQGLKGKEIPLGARIIAVTDAYHAMTSHRPYRPSLGHDYAVAELRRCAGTHFDPDVVDAFLQVLEAQRERLSASPRLEEDGGLVEERAAS